MKKAATFIAALSFIVTTHAAEAAFFDVNLPATASAQAQAIHSQSPSVSFFAVGRIPLDNPAFASGTPAVAATTTNGSFFSVVVPVRAGWDSAYSGHPWYGTSSPDARVPAQAGNPFFSAAWTVPATENAAPQAWESFGMPFFARAATTSMSGSIPVPAGQDAPFCAELPARVSFFERIWGSSRMQACDGTVQQ